MTNSSSELDESLLLPDAFDVLRNHFKDREGFDSEYKKIPHTIKIKFLRLASIYKHLVKEGNFNVPPEALLDSSFNYYDLTYKYIALISIIEAVMGKNEWLDFEEKEFLKTKLAQHGAESGKDIKLDMEIDEIANKLYTIRSDFVHGAKLIIEFGDITAITEGRKKGIFFVSELSLDQLMRIFEKAFIRYFGMQPERKLPLF